MEFSFQGFIDYFNNIKHSSIMCYSEPDVSRRQKTGIITVNDQRRVASFEEKPNTPRSDLAVPPFYLYTAQDLARIPEAISKGCLTDAPGGLAAWMIQHTPVYAWKMPGKRYDIGSINGYRDVQRQFTPPVIRLPLR